MVAAVGRSFTLAALRGGSSHAWVAAGDGPFCRAARRDRRAPRLPRGDGSFLSAALRGGSHAPRSPLWGGPSPWPRCGAFVMHLGRSGGRSFRPRGGGDRRAPRSPRGDGSFLSAALRGGSAIVSDQNYCCCCCVIIRADAAVGGGGVVNCCTIQQSSGGARPRHGESCAHACACASMCVHHGTGAMTTTTMRSCTSCIVPRGTR